MMEREGEQKVKGQQKLIAYKIDYNKDGEAPPTLISRIKPNNARLS
jgi:hypothetical protein